MTAWENLKALSALVTGTAWQLLTSPKTSGTGLVINDGVAVVGWDGAPTTVYVTQGGVDVAVQDRSVSVSVE